MSRQGMEEAYSMLDEKEQGKIQEISDHINMIEDIGDTLSEEAKMVFDMIMKMPMDEAESAISSVDSDLEEPSGGDSNLSILSELFDA